LPIAEAVVKQTQNHLFPPRSRRRARTGTVAVLRGARLRLPWVMGSTVHGALAGAWLLRRVLVPYAAFASNRGQLLSGPITCPW